VSLAILGESKYGAESASFEVFRDKGTNGEVAVFWNATANSGADPTLDVSPVSGKLTFSPGANSTLIIIRSLPDKVSVFFFVVSLLTFSNSLIIHKEKTKEITTVTVVWIPDLN